jgi:hypothetical protein
MEPSLDTWIQIRDDTKKINIPYFSLRICCNQKINGELSLLKSIVKNTRDATIFDVGAIGSQFPKDIDDSMTLHLFDPEFKPSGDAFKNDSTYTMYKENINYDKPNIHINKTVVDSGENSLQKYCEFHDIKHIDFLKIDTDGHDLGVLDGLGNITVGMVQFEYDNIYRLNSLDIKDIFKRLEGWHFFYILPSGLLQISDMREDYVYTNIFASKDYPHEIIKDYVPVMNDTIVNTKHVGDFICEMFWEMRGITPENIKINHCIANEEDDIIDVNWNLDQALKNYHGIYSR